MKTLLLVGLAALLGLLVVLQKSHRAAPLAEQKRRARSGDRKASKVYKASSFGAELDWFLWTSITITGVALFILLADRSWILAAVGLAAFGAVQLLWHPSPNLSSWHWSVSSLMSPIEIRAVGFAWPLLAGLASLAHPHPKNSHTGLFERDDLLELIKKQKKQSDNRIDERDLRLAHGALTFTSKTVREAMVPRSKLQTVKGSSTIGPVLMDELHKSGAQSFIVTSENAKNKEDFVGTLHLSDVVDHPEGGVVKDLVQSGVHYINESQNLGEALGEFLKSHDSLMVVVNDFEEMVGALGLDDLMRHIIGTNPTNEHEKTKPLSELELSPVPVIATEGDEQQQVPETVIPPSSEAEQS